MTILRYLLPFLLVLISNVNTEEQTKYGETQEIQGNKSNGSIIDNTGYGGAKYDGGKRPDGVVINNNVSERIHVGSEDKENQQIQANRTDGSNYVYNKRYGVSKYDGGRRQDGGGIYSNDSERRYVSSEKEETEEIQGNKTNGSNYIYNRRHSADKYDASRRHYEGEIKNNYGERRYGGSEEEETEGIQANRTDGSNYMYNRRYSGVEYDSGTRQDGGKIYSNNSDSRHYVGSEEEETEKIQVSRTDGSNYKYNRRYGSDKYDGGRRHNGGGSYRTRNDSRRRHGGNVRERTREIVDKIKDLGKYMFNGKYGGDESDGGRRHDSGARRYGGSQRYHGSQRRNYSQQFSNNEQHSYHPRHGDRGSKTSKLNTFIEYLIPVAEFIAIVGPMLK